MNGNMKVNKKQRKKSIEIGASYNLNFNVAALCSVKPLNNIATKKEKSMDAAAFYERKSFSAVAPKGMLEDVVCYP